MEISRVKYLVEALINSKLSRSDLDDFLDGLSDDEIVKAYSELFEAYFHELLEIENQRQGNHN